MNQYMFKPGDRFRLLYGTKSNAEGTVTKIDSIAYRRDLVEPIPYHTMYVRGRLDNYKREGAWMFSSIQLIRPNLNEHTKTL